MTAVTGHRAGSWNIGAFRKREVANDDVEGVWRCPVPDFFIAGADAGGVGFPRWVLNSRQGWHDFEYSVIQDNPLGRQMTAFFFILPSFDLAQIILHHPLTKGIMPFFVVREAGRSEADGDLRLGRPRWRKPS